MREGKQIGPGRVPGQDHQGKPSSPYHLHGNAWIVITTLLVMQPASENDLEPVPVLQNKQQENDDGKDR